MTQSSLGQNEVRAKDQASTSPLADIAVITIADRTHIHRDLEGALEVHEAGQHHVDLSYDNIDTILDEISWTRTLDTFAQALASRTIDLVFLEERRLSR